jgi:3D (Asp-Asp-Asp) domain-containing protein
VLIEVSATAEPHPDLMKHIIFIIICLSFPGPRLATAAEQTVLARITVYWHKSGSGDRACSNGARLRAGHCAVDPRKIPYGAQILFPDLACLAVDTGPDVVNRRASRACGRTASERNALVIDRFFETKREALAWAGAHPHFMTVRIVPKESKHPAVKVLAVERGCFFLSDSPTS